MLDCENRFGGGGGDLTLAPGARGEVFGERSSAHARCSAAREWCGAPCFPRGKDGEIGLREARSPQQPKHAKAKWLVYPGFGSERDYPLLEVGD